LWIVLVKIRFAIVEEPRRLCRLADFKALARVVDGSGQR
jgi:hypothetical protein